MLPEKSIVRDLVGHEFASRSGNWGITDLIPDAVSCGVLLLWSALSICCGVWDFTYFFTISLFVTLLAKWITCTQITIFSQDAECSANSQLRDKGENRQGIVLALLSWSFAFSLSASLSFIAVNHSIQLNLSPLSLSLFPSLFLCFSYYLSLSLSHFLSFLSHPVTSPIRLTSSLTLFLSLCFFYFSLPKSFSLSLFLTPTHSLGPTHFISTTV